MANKKFIRRCYVDRRPRSDYRTPLHTLLIRDVFSRGGEFHLGDSLVIESFCTFSQPSIIVLI